MTERELIEGCLRGNPQCERALFDRYAGRMMSVCLRYAKEHSEAEDILQEGFIKVYANLKSFRHEGSFEGWVRRIMVTSALKYLRKARPTQELSVIEEFRESPDLPDVIAHLGEQEIMKLVCNLPDGYRAVFNLYVIEGYKHQEIADMLSIEESTSRSQLVKARKWLQEKVLAITRVAL